MKKSLKALIGCAQWLEACIEIEWEKSDLDDLEKLWWKYHDPQTGELLK